MDRQEMIDDLQVFTGIALEVLESMTNEELEHIYTRRVLERGMI